MKPDLRPFLPAIRDTCQRHQVRRLSLFGSACTDDFDPATSDLDFLVELQAGASFGPWLSGLDQLKSELAAILGRPVDVVTRGALRNPHFRRLAEPTMQTIYDEGQIAEVAQ